MTTIQQLLFALLACGLMTTQGAVNSMSDNAKTCVRQFVKKELKEEFNIYLPENSINPLLGGDMMVTEKVACSLQSKRRKKRKSLNYAEHPDAKWSVSSPSTCIPYRFQNGAYTDQQKQQIRDALTYWQIRTCVCFQELTSNTNLPEAYVEFQTGGGCISYVGKAERVPQPLYLQGDSCLTLPGVAIHEIGHLLGLIHEHQRHDRNSFIRINQENIKDGEISNFVKLEEEFADTKGPNQEVYPYDYTSLMHYDCLAFSKYSDRCTLDAIDVLFQDAMGQRVEASFWDVKAINDDYCSAKCPTKLACQNQGYTDPNDCSKCRCPDGFAGTYCTQLAPSVGASCGGQLMADYTARTLQSPLYPSGYGAGSQCTWKITATNGGNVKLKFIGEQGFGVFKYERSCYEWVGIHYKNPLYLPGPRFCGRVTPSNVLVSEGDSAMVLFRSHWTGAVSSGDRRGFRLSYEEVNPCDSVTCQNGGSCNPSTPHKCSCLPGYAGTRCETNINDCSPNPCMNSGVCQDKVNDYECTCQGGYTGKNCQTPPPSGSACISNPCQNGATCTNQGSGFVCTCTTDFTGTLCQQQATCGGCGQKPGCFVNPCEDPSQLTGGKCTKLQRIRRRRTRTVGWWFFRSVIHYIQVSYQRVEYDCYKQWCCSNSFAKQTNNGMTCGVTGSYWTPSCRLSRRSYLVTFYQSGNKLEHRVNYTNPMCCENYWYSNCRRRNRRRGRGY